MLVLATYDSVTGELFDVVSSLPENEGSLNYFSQCIKDFISRTEGDGESVRSLGIFRGEVFMNKMMPKACQSCLQPLASLSSDL